MMLLPHSLDVLRQRDYRLLFGAQAVSLLGDGMVNVALAFAVLGIGGSAPQVGLVFACRAVALVGSLLVGGVVADRVERRAVMVAADVVRLASQGATAALLVTGEARIWMLALLAASTGAATGFFNPASTGLLPSVVSGRDVQRANGLRGTAMAGGEIAGPLVAAALVVSIGAGWALAIDALTFGVSALLLVRLPVRAHVPAVRTSFVRDLRAGWSEFRARRWVWTVVAAASAQNMLWGAWTALGPVVAKNDLGGARAWGTVLAAMGVGGVVGGVLALRATPRRPLVVFAVAGIVFSAPLGLLAAAAPLGSLAVATLVAGAAMTLGNSVWESTLQRWVPADALSRVSSYDWFGSYAFYPLGLAVWGPLAAVIGVSTALWIACALHLAVTIGLLFVAEIRHMSAAPTLERAVEQKPQPLSAG